MRSVLLITESLDGGATKEQSLEPLTRSAAHLRDVGLNVVGRVAARGREIGPAIANARADVVVLCPHFTEDVGQLAETLRAARDRRNRPALVLLDTFDQSSTPLLPLLDLVDRYAKKVLLRDRSRYLGTFAGGYVFTDWLARTQAFDLRGWHFGSVAPGRASLAKLTLAWNFAGARRFRRLMTAGRFLSRRWRRRRVHVNARFTPAGRGADARGDWYLWHREQMRQALDQRCSHLRLTPRGRIGRRAYLREQWDSRVIVSPFGYGELCLRDVEAIAAGAVLVKPDMGHLEVSPDLFTAGETYVPVQWDGSDAGEAAASVACDEGRAYDIACAARQRLQRYLDERGWVADARRVFQDL